MSGAADALGPEELAELREKTALILESMVLVLRDQSLSLQELRERFRRHGEELDQLELERIG